MIPTKTQTISNITKHFSIELTGFFSLWHFPCFEPKPRNAVQKIWRKREIKLEWTKNYYETQRLDGNNFFFFFYCSISPNERKENEENKFASRSKGRIKCEIKENAQAFNSKWDRPFVSHSLGFCFITLWLFSFFFWLLLSLLLLPSLVMPLSPVADSLFFSILIWQNDVTQSSRLLHKYRNRKSFKSNWNLAFEGSPSCFAFDQI